MIDTKAVKYEQEIPDILRSMSKVHQMMDAHGFDRTIHHLVQLRASQINRCGFCVKLHTKEARKDGEMNERLDRVTDFNAQERAPLAWTEALTVLDPETELGALRALLRKQFSEKEIGILTATVAMVNLWNRIRISGH